MCGIVGVVSAAPIDSGIVERMRDRMVHRGPDDAGLWLSDDARVCLAHRRLSIIDPDARSRQPMRSKEGNLLVTFNGEIYNYRSVRMELAAAGVSFRTESDTEVLLEAYGRWGMDALDRLSGMFAFALWDADRRRLVCVRDRAGEKPLYYALVDGAFLFASEIKGLLDWPALPRRLDYEAVIDFLSFGYVADPRSIWRDIRKLPPAHSITIDLTDDAGPVAGAPRLYWSLDFRNGTVPSHEEIRETLLGAADEMSVADVPLGTFLSGGVDSSSVTAALSLSGHDVRTFSVGFDDVAYDERPWARQVAQRYGTTHVERTVDLSDVLSVSDTLNWHYDEPFADYSSFPTYYLCREARSSITVALSGDGADEIFAGYRKYQRLARRAAVSRILPEPAAQLAAAMARRVLPEGNHWRRTLGQYGLSVPHMLADMLSIGFPLAILQRVARGPLADALRGYDPRVRVEQLLADTPPQEIGLINAMRHLDFALTLPGNMLVKVDRASMAVSLEVRPLFLNRSVMELAARTPDMALVSTHAAKLALKDAVRPWLPDALLDRRKQGFALPMPRWLGEKSSLAAIMHRTSDPGPMSEMLDMAHVRELSAAQARGQDSFTAIVYSVFILDQWLNKWSTV